jgi:predicted RecA/RadA family phage recombinase
MKNYVQEGEALTVTAPYDVAAGAGVKVGAIFGVAINTATSGNAVQIQREGVFDIAKTGSQAWTAGDPIYWDATNKLATNVKGAGLPIGYALLAALSADATGRVVLANGEGVRVVSGQMTTATASDTVATGLSKVIGAVAGLDSDPSADPTAVSCSIGDQAGAPVSGSIIIKSWKTIATPTAATTFSKKVNWLAWGY